MAFIDNEKVVHDALVLDCKIKTNWKDWIDKIYNYTNNKDEVNSESGDESIDESIDESYFIVNNEEVIFDFSKNIFYRDPSTECELQPYKILIEYGDGEKETLIKNFKLLDDISYKEKNPWAVCKHRFNISKEKTKINLRIDFCFENGAVFKMVIPFTVIFKTMEEMNIDLILLNANITNDGGVSYLFKNTTNDNVIIVKKKLDNKTFILDKEDTIEDEETDIFDGFDENNIPENFDITTNISTTTNFKNFSTAIYS